MTTLSTRKLPLRGVNVPTLTPGTILQGRYHIIKALGAGGMGAVYQARDLHFPNVIRLCAVKEMINNASDPYLREMAIRNFEREANILATLDHPAIPEVFDYFSQDDRSYLVLEYINGSDLEALLNQTEGFFPEDRVRDWAIQICDVLIYLHGHSPNPIIFRDLKPSNIMLDQHDRIRLVDFGIAKVFEANQKGTMIGTEGYAPPEQYRGQAGPRGDIYALGATLHHLLTRQDPRTEPPFSFADRPIRAINPNVSPAFEAVIMTALAYNAEDRFPSAAAMKAALLATAQSQVLPTNEAGPELTRKLTIHLSKGGVVPLWTFACEDEVRSTPAVAEGLVYVSAYDNNLYALSAKEGRFQWKYATQGGMASSPCVHEGVVYVGSEDKHIYAVHARLGRIVWSTPTEGPVRSSPRIQYNHVFVGSDDGYLYALNAQTGRVAWRVETGGPVRSSPAFGDDLILFGSEDGYLYAVTIKGAIKWRFHAKRAMTSSPCVYQGSVYVGSQDAMVYALSLTSGWALWRYKTSKSIVSSPTVANGIVYIGSADGCLYALDAQSGRLIWRYATEGQVASSPLYVNGAVYFGSVDRHVYCLDGRSGELRWKFETDGPVVSSPAQAEGIIYIGSCDRRVYALPA